MSDKAWNPEVERIRKAMMERFSDKLSMEEIAEFAYSVAVECRAIESFGDWCDMKGIEPTMGQVDAFVREQVRAATPQVTPESAPELELEQEADGRWLAEFLRFTGAMAYGKSPEEAIRNAAKVLIESEPASPTPDK